MISRHYPLPDLDQAQRLLEQIFSGVPAFPPEDHDTEVILYGAGNLGRMACEFLDYVGVNILHAYDQAAKDGDTLGGSVPVYQPSEPGVHGNHLILVTTLSVPYTEIERFLISLGWKRILPFYDYALQYSDIHPLNNGWFSGPLSHEDREMIQDSLLLFTDYQSYAAYLQFLAWRVLREDWIFDDVSVTKADRFFIEPICNVLTDNEIFLDVGSYHGDVFFRFLELSKGKFLSAVLIEPDRTNITTLRKKVSSLPDAMRKKITIIHKCVGTSSGSVKFGHSFGYASRIWDISNECAEVVTIDGLFIPFSFMKMHIEGGEMDALSRGKDLLVSSRPIIAITIYHNRDGLWKLMHFLKDLLEEYLFFVRMHSWCGTGIIIYGIPKEIRRDFIDFNY
ncbi:FkbM family methyltransferase [Methanospirillum sp. J.3.6.1-F.2.7.3]|uniref:FkbM family methyltransferase n=1 Tax=Methanospirillum purgamenti TaxID=2834276 RepID=A0A8E7B2C8_9EURY|nr:MULTISPECIES: FkbM family methyltransferase [Methanospirillum]MDX8551886.1 FkbM family methyltransferase [Methanospirillum hungatei]QVV89162.1 FkbM family methyltransferase [Methanospirillum sp. J.3.6.1-F.2.7.3]